MNYNGHEFEVIRIDKWKLFFHTFSAHRPGSPPIPIVVKNSVKDYFVNEVLDSDLELTTVVNGCENK